MPYSISERDGKFHVHKEGSEESLGAHDSREDAENQIKAIEANEHTDPPPVPHHEEAISALTERLNALESTVQSLLPENKDETPVKAPWTHRRFG